MGCIIYELIKFTTRDTKDKPADADFTKKERYLFQGDSCYPLTPLPAKANGGDDQNEVGYHD